MLGDNNENLKTVKELIIEENRNTLLEEVETIRRLIKESENKTKDSVKTEEK